MMKSRPRCHQARPRCRCAWCTVSWQALPASRMGPGLYRSMEGRSAAALGGLQLQPLKQCSRSGGIARHFGSTRPAPSRPAWADCWAEAEQPFLTHAALAYAAVDYLPKSAERTLGLWASARSMEEHKRRRLQRQRQQERQAGSAEGLAAKARLMQASGAELMARRQAQQVRCAGCAGLPRVVSVVCGRLHALGRRAYTAAAAALHAT